MRKIDLESWPRREHFEVYRKFDFPHFNLTFPVTVTHFRSWVKARGSSLSLATTYLLARVANELSPFRLRIRGEEVVEHETVHPSFTVLLENELFSFCTVKYRVDFEAFIAIAETRIEQVRTDPILEDEPGQDDLLFMTTLPWFHFTSMMHPIHMNPVDSIPRIAWGRIDRKQGEWVMPLSVQVHHALMDGLHVGRFAERAQHFFNHPQELMRS